MDQASPLEHLLLIRPQHGCGAAHRCLLPAAAGAAALLGCTTVGRAMQQDNLNAGCLELTSNKHGFTCGSADGRQGAVGADARRRGGPSIDAPISAQMQLQACRIRRALHHLLRRQAWPAAPSVSYCFSASLDARHILIANIEPGCKRPGAHHPSASKASARAPASAPARQINTLTRLQQPSKVGAAGGAKKRCGAPVAGWRRSFKPLPLRGSLSPAVLPVGMKCDVHATEAAVARLDPAGPGFEGHKLAARASLDDCQMCGTWES